ncbi:MAG: PTS sugar transporter subunit IIC, partial [Chloroflexi bacterium]|nr:PTS sugar transporter subunit IIC [Chloroflexota bacterium]
MSALVLCAVGLLAAACSHVPAPAASEGALPWGAALAIALLYYLSQSAWLAGLGFWTLYRPLVAGLLVGVILGDPAQGTRVGATINLAYLGFIATGGALPSDIALAGYVGTTLALVGGLDAQAAMAASLPVGMLGYLAYQLR